MNQVKITPLHDRVVVQPEKVTNENKVIMNPDTAKEKPSKGIVIAVGSGRKDEPMTVKAGDSVLYSKHAGTDVKIEGEDFLIMRETDIFAVI